MVRGFIIIATACFARVLLKKLQYRHHILGLIILITGLIIVGLATIFGGADHEKTEIGFLIMLLVAKTLSSCQFVAEEWLLRDYNVDPLKVVGLEGMWGCIYWCIALPIL